MISSIKHSIPEGCLLTGGVLGGGLWSMKEGNAKLSQKFMRTRVLAQGATVIMLCIGGKTKQNKKVSRERESSFLIRRIGLYFDYLT